MLRARIDENDRNNWVRCGRCGHKLFMIVSTDGCNAFPTVEIKCHSCKALNEWRYDDKRSNDNVD